MAKIIINKECKKAILDCGISQGVLAGQSDIPRTLLNQIINGRVNPTKSEKEKISSALKRKTEELFPD